MKYPLSLVMVSGLFLVMGFEEAKVFAFVSADKILLKVLKNNKGVNVTSLTPV